MKVNYSKRIPIKVEKGKIHRGIFLVRDLPEIGRKDLEAVHPFAVRFFERMQLTEKQLNSLVYHVRLSEDPRQGVKNWMIENEYIFNQWV